jgi:hypothetical protein
MGALLEMGIGRREGRRECDRVDSMAFGCLPSGGAAKARAREKKKNNYSRYCEFAGVLKVSLGIC